LARRARVRPGRRARAKSSPSSSFSFFLLFESTVEDLDDFLLVSPLEAAAAPSLQEIREETEGRKVNAKTDGD